MSCAHKEFSSECRIGRLLAKEGDTEPVGFTADIRIHCTQCGEPFQFIGLPCGSSPTFPTVSIDAQQARMPIAPASSTASPLDHMEAASSPKH